jgi:sulfatase maturation enzyme AslB (radical SAM superfamily)
MRFTILYRGPLSSCNYGCGYCPFAKRAETHAELAGDRTALKKFLEWAGAQGGRGHELSILFTPWGEALIRPWYQQALATLTHLPHVIKAAIQTNLSCHLNWLDDCDPAKLGLWCTYHPGETTREKFLARCRALDDRRISYSVGVVGMREHLTEIESLRRELRPGTYLWVNAYKRESAYYAEADLAMLTAIDPLFPVNNMRHPSRGRECVTGETAFSVAGDGTMTRCHFINTPIGNVYDDHWESHLKRASCTNDTCGCHIGYVHMPELKLQEVFGDGMPERVPRSLPILRQTSSVETKPPCRSNMEELNRRNAAEGGEE